MREKKTDPLDDLRMEAISIQFDAKRAVVDRIKSSGEVKEDNSHWLTRIHKLRHPMLSEEEIGEAGTCRDKPGWRV